MKILYGSYNEDLAEQSFFTKYVTLTSSSDVTPTSSLHQQQRKRYVT